MVTIESIKENPHQKGVGEGGDKDIPIGQQGANRDDVEIRKERNQKKEERKKDHLGPSKRKETESSQG